MKRTVIKTPDVYQVYVCKLKNCLQGGDPTQVWSTQGQADLQRQMLNKMQELGHHQNNLFSLQAPRANFPIFFPKNRTRILIKKNSLRFVHLFQ